MSNLFLFRFNDESNDRKQSIAVFGANELSSNDIETIVKKDVGINLTPSKIYIICLYTQKNNLEKLSINETRVKAISSLISNTEESIEFISVTQDGVFENIKNGNALDAALQDNILQAGGIEIFEKRQGLLTSSAHYHFLKPSGAHCDKFIRVSNLLTSGNEVCFIALGLLPNIAKNIKHIYVDTSSISFLIMTALQLSGKYHEALPIIESFASYAALNKRYDFVEGPTTTVFVSATTSGGLVAKLGEDTNLYKDRIFTLFFSRLGDGQTGFFDISSLDVVKDIYSKPAEECKLCKDNSKLINIVSEQFLPETPRHKKLLIKKVDFKNEREKFFKEFATHELLHWSLVESNTVNEHFYIDIKKYLANPELSKTFIETLHTVLNKSFSRNIYTIITLDDEGSKALTDKVQQYLGEDKSQFKWLLMSELEGTALNCAKSAMVIAGAITSGRKLLAASRKLRELNDVTSIKYLVGISKLPTISVSTQLNNDLKQGGHELIILKKCPLPRVKEHVITAWNREVSIYETPGDLFEGNQKQLPEMFEIRNILLTGKVSELTGERADPEYDTQNDLFLPRPDGERLVLRNTFAFWYGLEIDCAKASQADVYWSIQAIFHDLRLKNADTGLESTYHSTVLSPICFDRYNDGVIQACLLRAATPAELNYTIDEVFSNQMTDILVSIVENWDNAQGEGCLEFLMSLASKRMKVLDSDLLRVLELIHVENMDKNVKFLLECISEESGVAIPN